MNRSSVCAVATALVTAMLFGASSAGAEPPPEGKPKPKKSASPSPSPSDSPSPDPAVSASPSPTDTSPSPSPGVTTSPSPSPSPSGSPSPEPSVSASPTASPAESPSPSPSPTPTGSPDAAAPPELGRGTGIWAGEQSADRIEAVSSVDGALTLVAQIQDSERYYYGSTLTLTLLDTSGEHPVVRRTRSLGSGKVWFESVALASDGARFAVALRNEYGQVIVYLLDPTSDSLPGFYIGAGSGTDVALAYSHAAQAYLIVYEAGTGLRGGSIRSVLLPRDGHYEHDLLPVTTVASSSSSVPDTPAVASNGADFVVAWRGDRVALTSVSATGIPAQHVSTVGGPVGGKPVVATDGSSYLLAWTELSAAGEQIVAAPVSPDGRVARAETAVYATQGHSSHLHLGWNGTSYDVAWSPQLVPLAERRVPRPVLTGRASAVGERLDAAALHVGDTYCACAAVARAAHGRTALAYGHHSWDTVLHQTVVRLRTGTVPLPDFPVPAQPVDPDPGTPTLSNGVPVEDVSGAARTSKRYKIYVPPGVEELRVEFSGPPCSVLSCDPRLEVFLGRSWVLMDWHDACAEPQSSGTCVLDYPPSGWWYVGVHVEQATTSGSYRVSATF